MSGVSLPVNRQAGHVLIVGSPACRVTPINVLQQQGLQCGEAEDPYAAMVELCRRPLAYRALILSLQSLFREELSIIAAIKQRFAHVEIWLAQTDGRQAALAEAMRLGADGLLSDDGLHRVGLIAPPPAMVASNRGGAGDEARPRENNGQPSTMDHDELGIGETVLTAEELRALLQEQPILPPTRDTH